MKLRPTESSHTEGFSPQKQRRQRVQDIEDRLVGEKKWFERGEVTADRRPKNSLAAQRSDDDDESSGDAGPRLDFVRNKMVIRPSADRQREIEKSVRDKVRAKSFDNPSGKSAFVPPSAATETAAETHRETLHDVYAGQSSHNDRFMEKSEMARLFCEIDAELCSLSDHTYTSTSLPFFASVDKASGTPYPRGISSVDLTADTLQL